MDRIKQLRDRKASLLAEADRLAVKEQDGSITEDETKRLDAITGEKGELDKVNAQIKREERLMDERRSMPAAGNANGEGVDNDNGNGRVEIVKETAKFKSSGEYFRAVAHAGQQGVRQDEWDRRLVSLYQPGGMEPQAAASGLNEAVPSEGGFLVQQDIATPMLESMFNTGEILPLVRRFPISANSNGIKMPAVDETSRADGSRMGGVRGYWADEADLATASKPKFRMMDMRLKKLLGLAYVTEEMLMDAAFLGSWLTMAFTEELTFKTEDGVINGNGAGKLLGVLNSGALISVAAESGQAAATVVTQNILNMWNRLPMRSRRNAIWLINQDVEPQLDQLTLGSGTAVTMLMTQAGTNGNNTPYGRLKGRPVIPVEYTAALGTVGDIILMDPTQFAMIDKGGIQSAASMHVRFLYDEMTYRFTYRVDGQPMQRSAITPKNGNNTLSPYVALATRS